MKINLTILFCFLINVCFSQSRIIYPYGWEEMNYEKVVLDIEGEIHLEKDSSILCRYYFLLASAYANIDSIKTVMSLEQSFTYSNHKFCYFFNSFKEYNKSDNVPEWVKKVKYYLHEPQFIDLNLKYLNKCSFSKSEIKKTSLVDLVMMIKSNDQKFRRDSIVDWSNQGLLDEKNRRLLDSLFTESNTFFKKYTNQEIEVFWYVLQHSTDCEWNEKWIIRFLDAYQMKLYTGGFLNQTIKRFFNPKNGYCQKYRNEFILVLKEKYPKEYGDTFGYNTY